MQGCFFQRSTLPLHRSDRGDNLSACKHTFSQSTFTLTPAHRYWIKPCSKGKTGRWINPVLLDLIHSYTEWRCTSQSLGSLLGSLGVALHTEDLAIQWVTSIFIRLYGQRASTVLQDKHGKTFYPRKEIHLIHISELKQYISVCFHSILCLTSQR